MKLPQEFVARMKDLLGSEFQDFLETYSKPRYYGLRVNTLKLSIDEYKKLSVKTHERIPWAIDGLYYDPEDNPGKHPYYHAGLYYIQEPSAMAPAEILGALPGERVLDLCAAPGGKTMQIAAAMKGQGVLVANEISQSRVKALLKHIELYGVKNAIVTNETPQRLASKLRVYFDRILVDAPCSGEGMMRKDEQAARSWRVYNSEKCASMQTDILEQADIMLRPGGRLVYSTCTFTPEENEQIICRFLENHNNYELIDIEKHSGISPGISVPGYSHPTEYCARFWPHKLKGEGHFAAVLEKRDGDEYIQPMCRFKTEEAAVKLAADFFKRYLDIDFPELTELYGLGIHSVKPDFPDMSGMRVLRTGWRLGTIDRGIFEPAHSLAMGLLAGEIKNTIFYDIRDVELDKYLKGETLFSDCPDSWAAVCTGRFPLGWVKVKGGMMKNYYPKGWRRNA